MVDIVERLRQQAAWDWDKVEAADEIERLRRKILDMEVSYRFPNVGSLLDEIERLRALSQFHRRDGLLEAARLMENAFGDKYAAKAIRSLAEERMK